MGVLNALLTEGAEDVGDVRASFRHYRGMTKPTEDRWLTIVLATLFLLLEPAVARASTIEGSFAFLTTPLFLVDAVCVGLCWWVMKKHPATVGFLFYLLVLNAYLTTTTGIGALGDALLWGTLDWMMVLALPVVIATWALSLYVLVQAWKLKREHRRAKTARMLDEAMLGQPDGDDDVWR